MFTNLKMQDGTVVSNTEENVTYYYDFNNRTSLSFDGNGTYGLIDVQSDVK